ncbi:MAG: GntR family transcriptional regulator [Alphaproteobacteria bacterium]|nr:MAG: GntR family transcriptional regulator [Alphaproteobacteria bacterium]
MGENPVKPSRTGKKNPREEYIHQQISDAILEQRLAPGTKLTEESLSEIFGASRTVVRRALTRLNYENIVEIRPNRGAIVASPSTAQALQVFEARQIIEEAALRICVRKHSAGDVANLKNLVQAEKDCIAGNDRIAWIRLTGNFHLEIARIAGNEVIAKFLKELISQTSLIIALYGKTGGSLCSNDDHGKIVKAISQNDEQKAVAMMLTHLEECVGSLNMEDKQETRDLKSIFSSL